MTCVLMLTAGQRGGRPMSGRMRTGQVTAGPSREAAYGVALSQEVKVTDRPVTQQVYYCCISKYMIPRFIIVVYIHNAVGIICILYDVQKCTMMTLLVRSRVSARSLMIYCMYTYIDYL